MAAWGYPSTEPCIVCGKNDNNQSEPRFGYTACETHRNVPPTKIQTAIDHFKILGVTQWDERPYR